jgi:uncharacterized membrane protein YbhN (UPF0104 family)
VPKLRWPQVARIALGALLLIGVLLYVNPAQLAQVIVEASPEWLILAGAIVCSTTLIGALNLYLLVAHERDLTFSQFLPLYWIAWAVGLVIPGQVGDVASITALMHRQGHVWKTVLGRSLLDKAVSFAILIGLALYGIERYTELSVPWLPLGFAMAIVALILWALTRGGASTRRAGKALSLVRELSHEITTCWTTMPSRVLLNVGLTIVKVVLTAVAYWSAFCAVGEVDLPIPPFVPLVAVSSVIAYVPVSFNGLGTTEAAGIALFGTLGVGSAVVLGAYLLLRVTVMAIGWIPAAILLSVYRYRTDNVSPKA